MLEDERGVEQNEQHDRHRADEHPGAQLITRVHDQLAASPAIGAPDAYVAGRSHGVG
jgi:hypothetical protein